MSSSSNNSIKEAVVAKKFKLQQLKTRYELAYAKAYYNAPDIIVTRFKISGKPSEKTLNAIALNDSEVISLAGEIALLEGEIQTLTHGNIFEEDEAGGGEVIISPYEKGLKELDASIVNGVSGKKIYDEMRVRLKGINDEISKLLIAINENDYGQIRNWSQRFKEGVGAYHDLTTLMNQIIYFKRMVYSKEAVNSINALDQEVKNVRDNLRQMITLCDKMHKVY